MEDHMNYYDVFDGSSVSTVSTQEEDAHDGVQHVDASQAYAHEGQPIIEGDREIILD